MSREFRAILCSVLMFGLAIVLVNDISLAQKSPAKGTAESFYEQARQKVGRLDYDGAIQEMTVAIGLDPRNAEYFYYRGYCYSGRDNAKALADYDRALKLKPDHKEALFGRVYINLKSNKQKA
ncbi:MAG: tetratricopeptide repeat protein, partial [Pyrinomonadaceae bacterium]